MMPLLAAPDFAGSEHGRTADWVQRDQVTQAAISHQGTHGFRKHGPHVARAKALNRGPPLPGLRHGTRIQAKRPIAFEPDADDAPGPDSKHLLVGAPPAV